MAARSIARTRDASHGRKPQGCRNLRGRASGDSVVGRRWGPLRRYDHILILNGTCGVHLAVEVRRMAFNVADMIHMWGCSVWFPGHMNMRVGAEVDLSEVLLDDALQHDHVLSGGRATGTAATL